MANIHSSLYTVGEPSVGYMFAICHNVDEHVLYIIGWDLVLHACFHPSDNGDQKVTLWKSWKLPGVA